MVKRIRNGNLTGAESRTLKKFGNQENNLSLKETKIFMWEIKLNEEQERLSRDEFVTQLVNSSGADVILQFIPSILGDEGTIFVKDLGGKTPVEIKTEEFRSFYTQSKVRELETFLDISDDGIIRFITFEDLQIDETTGNVLQTQEIYLLNNIKNNPNVNSSYGGSIWTLNRISRNVVLNSQGDSAQIIIKKDSQIPVNAKFRILEFDSLILGFQNIIFIGGTQIRIDELRGYDIIEYDGFYEMVSSETTGKKEWNPSVNWAITTGSRNVTVVNPWISELNWSKAIFDVLGNYSQEQQVEQTSDYSIINLGVKEIGGGTAEMFYQNTNKEFGGDIIVGNEETETSRFLFTSIWSDEYLSTLSSQVENFTFFNPQNSFQQLGYGIENLEYNTSILIARKGSNVAGWDLAPEDLDEFINMIKWGFNNEGDEPPVSPSGTKLNQGYKNNNGLSFSTSSFFVLKNTDNQPSGLNNGWLNQFFLTDPRAFKGASSLYVQDKLLRGLANEITGDVPANNANNEESFSISEPIKNPNYSFEGVVYDLENDILTYPEGNNVAKINSDIMNGLSAVVSGTSFDTIYYDIDTGLIKDIDENDFNVAKWPSITEPKFMLLTPEKDIFNYYNSLISYKNFEGIIINNGNYTKQSGYVNRVFDLRVGAGRYVNWFRFDCPDATSTQTNRMERLPFDNTSSSPFSGGVVKVILRLETEGRWAEDDLIYIGSKNFKDTLLDKNLNLAVDAEGKVIKPRVRQSIAFKKNNKRYVVDKEIFI